MPAFIYGVCIKQASIHGGHKITIVNFLSPVLERETLYPFKSQSTYMEDKNKRNHIVKFRANDVELEDIKSRIPDGFTRAEFLRNLLSGQPVQVRKKSKPAPIADPNLIREISRIGNNLNQIARVVNQFGDQLDAFSLVKNLRSIEIQLENIVEFHLIKNQEQYGGKERP